MIILYPYRIETIASISFPALVNPQQGESNQLVTIYLFSRSLCWSDLSRGPKPYNSLVAVECVDCIEALSAT